MLQEVSRSTQQVRTSLHYICPQRNFSLVLIPYVGNVYIGDPLNRVRKVTVSTGIITTIAGTGNIGSYSGDGGAATSAALNYPYAVALDSAGMHFIAIVRIFDCNVTFLLVTPFRQRVHR